MRLIGRRILQAGESGDNAFHRGLVSDRPRDRSAASVRLSRPGRKSVVWRPETLTRVSCIFRYCTGIVRKQAITRAHTSMSAVGFSKNASRAHMHKHIRTCVAFSLTSRRSCVYTQTGTCCERREWATGDSLFHSQESRQIRLVCQEHEEAPPARSPCCCKNQSHGKESHCLYRCVALRGTTLRFVLAEMRALRAAVQKVPARQYWTKGSECADGSRRTYCTQAR